MKRNNPFVTIHTSAPPSSDHHISRVCMGKNHTGLISRLFANVKVVVSITMMLCLVGMMGCMTVNSPIRDELPALVGVADKAYFANRFGPPDKQVEIEAGTEMWEYRLGEQKFTSNTGYRFSTNERLRLTFREGRLIKWSIEGKVG